MMNEKLKGGLLVFFGGCSFGLLSTIVKSAYGVGYNVGQITGTQTLLGVVILWSIYLLQKQFKPKTIKLKLKEGQTKPTPLWKVILAGSFTGLVGIFYYNSVNYIPASIAIILLMQYLWISIIIEWVWFKKRPHKMQVIAALIVFIGTLFAGGIFNDKLDVLDPKGIFYGFLAAICYSIFLMTSGRVGNEYPVFKKSALMITGSMTLTWIIFPPLFLIDGTFFDGLYKWGLALALLGTVTPPLFFSSGIPRVGVSLGAILSASELPVAVTASHFILKEDVQGLQWLGVALILSAIALTNLKTTSKKNSEIQA